MPESTSTARTYRASPSTCPARRHQHPHVLWTALTALLFSYRPTNSQATRTPSTPLRTLYRRCSIVAVCSFRGQERVDARATQPQPATWRQRAYIDGQGRELSKLDINVASLVKQGYITDRDKIVVLTCEHAENIERCRAGNPLPSEGHKRLTPSDQVHLVKPQPRPPVCRGRDGHAGQRRRRACSCRRTLSGAARSSQVS